jgi:hypothetical protein
VSRHAEGMHAEKNHQADNEQRHGHPPEDRNL